MRIKHIKLLIGFLFCIMALFCSMATGWASELPGTWYRVDANKQVIIQVNLFLSSTCPHCQKADTFFKSLEKENKWLDVHRHEINKDKSALETFNQYLHFEHANDFIVPSIFFCKTRWAGFTDENRSGQQMLRALNYCREQLIKSGHLTPTAHQFLKQMATAHWYESNMTSNPSPASFIPLMAITDALNPSAIFSIVALFALLIVRRARTKQVGALIMFLLGVAIIHHLQQSHSTFFYATLANLRYPVILIGLITIFYVITYHPKGLIVKRPSIFLSLATSFLIGISIQIYQQNYTPNFALIFQQWLLSQSFSANRQITYDLIYQFVYVLTIGLVAVGLVIFSKYSRWKKYYSFIKEFAWQYLLIIGLILVCYPYFLSKFLFALLAIALALLSTWCAFKMWLKHGEVR